jgi:hypothetical protein
MERLRINVEPDELAENAVFRPKQPTASFKYRKIICQMTVINCKKFFKFIFGKVILSFITDL